MGPCPNHEDRFTHHVTQFYQTKFGELTRCYMLFYALDFESILNQSVTLSVVCTYGLVQVLLWLCLLLFS